MLFQKLSPLKRYFGGSELFSELTLMEVDNKQLLDKLSTIQKDDHWRSKKVVAEAIALKIHFR